MMSRVGKQTTNEHLLLMKQAKEAGMGKKQAFRRKKSDNNEAVLQQFNELMERANMP